MKDIYSSELSLNTGFLLLAETVLEYIGAGMSDSSVEGVQAQVLLISKETKADKKIKQRNTKEDEVCF